MGDRRDDVKTIVIFSYGVALAMNLVDAVVNPGGAFWWGTRLLVTVAFIVSVLAYVALWLVERRRRSGK